MRPRPFADPAPAFSPLYRRIEGLITKSLQSGEWRPGEMIPSEAQLAQRYKVSPGTVRKALDALAGAHLLSRRQGRGTFVATHAEERIQYRFLRLAPDDGKPAALERRFIDCTRQRARAEIARPLAMRPGEAALRVQRLLSARGRPVVLDDIWLPAGLFEGLSAERLSRYDGPMYRLFESEFGVRMIRAEERIKALAADPASAEWLGVAPGAPLLSVERVAYTYGDRPVELRRGLYHTAAHHYRNDLS